MRVVEKLWGRTTVLCSLRSLDGRKRLSPHELFSGPKTLKTGAVHPLRWATPDSSSLGVRGVKAVLILTHLHA